MTNKPEDEARVSLWVIAAFGVLALGVARAEAVPESITPEFDNHLMFQMTHDDHVDFVIASPCTRVAQRSWVCAKPFLHRHMPDPVEDGQFVPVDLDILVPDIGVFTQMGYNVFYECTPMAFREMPRGLPMGAPVFVWACKTDYEHLIQVDDQQAGVGP